MAYRSRQIAEALSGAIAAQELPPGFKLGERHLGEICGTSRAVVKQALIVLARRRGAVWPYAKKRWPLAMGGALASFGSYGIALWAMTRAPVATVAALRETSVLFAALLGSWFLKEAFTLRRALGTAVIVAGVMALRLG